MLLSSELDGWKVEYGTGETIGRVQDLIVDSREARWPVTALLLGRGVTRKTHLFDVPTEDLEIDRHERTLVRRGHAALREEPAGPSARDRLRLSSLTGSRVVSSDDKPIGKLYDFAIATSPLGGWLVWRFLVRVPGARSRRLRLAISDIQSIDKGQVVLQASRDDVRGAV